MNASSMDEHPASPHDLVLPRSIGWIIATVGSLICWGGLIALVQVFR
jgi:hypothetical protein